MRLPPLAKNLLLSLTTLVVVVGLAEAATRLVFESNSVFNMNIGGFRAYHPIRRTQLKSNYRADGITVNSHGILGPEFTVARKPGTVRLLSLGNSVTFAPVPRNYSRVLEDQLRASPSDSTLEVIVGAVPGYSSGDLLNWYDEFLHTLDPDITIIEVGWNDMGQYHPFGLRYKNEALYQERTLLGRLMETFHVLRVPYFVIGRMEERRPVDLSPMSADEAAIMTAFTPTQYETNLERLIVRVRERGSRVYLLPLVGLLTFEPTEEELARLHFPRNTGRKLAIYDAIHEKYVESMERVAARTGTPILPMDEIVRTPEQRLIFTDAMHLNEQGAERFGESIAAYLRPIVDSMRGTPAGRREP